MSFVGDFLGNTVGGITGAKQAGEATQEAAATQAGFSQQAIDEQKRQFDAFVNLLGPYVAAGNQSLQAQQNLIGLGGANAQQQAISQLQQSPMFTSLSKQGENAILQNASATGGLRGGNIESSLANYRTDLLNNLINQQYTNLGGITSLGQSAASGTGNAGMQTAANVGNLLGQQGAALAGGIMGEGNIARQTFGDIMSMAGMATGAKKVGMF